MYNIKYILYIWYDMYKLITFQSICHNYSNTAFYDTHYTKRSAELQQAYLIAKPYKSIKHSIKWFPTTWEKPN